METQTGEASGSQGANTLDLTVTEAGNANGKEMLCSPSPWEQNLVLLTGSTASLFSEDKDHCVGRVLFSLNKQIFLLISSLGSQAKN